MYVLGLTAMFLTLLTGPAVNDRTAATTPQQTFTVIGMIATTMMVIFIFILAPVTQ